ncbi:MAG: hypothetical protein Q4A68_00515 [Anaerobiospirillum succiniciproducens]|uniref:hypothetical protein n=1 Tax=Anaerobiospirillum succiniciproducens TaxID=13335 RepID=UPI0026DBA351|nr:hypothetical protein [Anaerobiospirillum succiniciproducens]MDO4675064.1 hypothetical protein [Anaerobiospirillum succiniciproducens]
MDDATRNKIIELIEANLSPAQISRELGISEKSALRFVRFKDIHGLDELKRLPSLTEDLKLTPRKLAAIVEFSHAYNMPQYMLELIFKTRSSLLGDCIEIRKLIGHALMDSPKVAKLPESVNLKYLEEYVKEHNGGQSLAQLHQAYCAQLELSEANASYLNIKEVSEFRRYTRVSKDDIAKFVLKYRSEGYSNAKIAALIGQTAHTVARYLNFIDLHGFDEAMRCTNLIDPQPLSKYDRACVVEFMIAYNYPLDAAAVLFKADKKQLETTYQQRLAAKVPLNGAIIARIPDSANMHVVNNLILKYNPDLSLGELKERYEQAVNAARTNAEATKLRDSLSGKYDENAKLSYKQAQQSKLKASLNSAKSKLELMSKLTKMDADVASDKSQEGFNEASYDAQNAQIVSLLELVTSLDEGMAVSEYLSKSDKSVGRPPKVNVFDQDFKNLPEKVQLLNYSRFVEDMRSLMEGAKARIDLERKLSAMDAYTKECTHMAMRLESYQSLIDKQPKLKRSLLQRALGLSPDKINYYTKLTQDEHMTRSLRTQLISNYVVQLYQEFEGKLTLNGIVQLLKSRHHIGISISKLKTILQALDLRLLEGDDHQDRL